MNSIFFFQTEIIYSNKKKMQLKDYISLKEKQAERFM